jgi:tetratricopeptide (TPR) repeat protein
MLAAKQPVNCSPFPEALQLVTFKRIASPSTHDLTADNMRWLQTEYILKGIYLGLLLFVALQEPTWLMTGLVALCTFGGLVLALALAGYRKLREGYQVKGRLLPFLLFLLLESPELIYAGILLGMTVAAYAILRQEGENWLLGATVTGGAVLGLAFWLLRHVQQRGVRLGLSLLLAAGLVAGALLWFGQFGDFAQTLALRHPILFGAQLLLGIPIFYLLTFAGRDEESEVEIGAMCAALGLGTGMLVRDNPNYQSVAFLVPVMLYFYYTTRILPHLRVFKHAVRGLSYSKIGRYRPALLSFRRALQLDPQNALAREGLWSVHRAMDLGQLAQDPQTLALVDLDLCLERAGSLLLQPNPTPEKLQEAHQLLDLIVSLRPPLQPAVHYWRAVAHTHARHFDQAAVELEQLLDPTAHAADDPSRRSVLLSAWQLALMWHPELNRRAGTPLLSLPGRRMEAIAAVERHLGTNPDDAEVWNLKRLLYGGVIEAEYAAATREDQPAAEFDHAYAQQLGLALIDDTARWQRGGEYLRLAARGLPALGPSLFSQIAKAHERAGNTEGALHNYELAKRAGRSVGPKALGDEDRQAYFAAVKLLAEAAQARGDVQAAIENYHLFAESERSGLETLRTLAELYERKGDPLSALRFTDQALIYNAKDKDLLERKDRYYYSVLPEDLKARLESVKGGFDIAYCLRKARSLLDARAADLDLLDWAQHLAALARIVEPDNRSPKVLVARARLRRGEKDEAVALLEEVRTPKPEKFASGEDEEAWYMACRLLGDLYLYDFGRADLAAECFNAYRQSVKSGADTMYKLGQAYEQLGDHARAAKWYKQVTAYDSHPLAPDAQDALHRLQAQ